MKKLVTFLVVLILFIFSAKTAGAVSVPSFPTCSNPSGVVKVKYDSGVHGIAGDSGEYRGSDIVYQVTDTTLLQCFCAEDGAGIQSNWWKASSLTQSEIDTLKTQGWVFIPSGSDWGLDPAPYMVKNADYSCKANGGGQVSSTSASTSSSGGQVLGLASTGDVITLYLVGGLGVLSLALSFLIKKLS